MLRASPGVRRLRCTGEAYGIELIRAAEPGHDHTAFELQQSDHPGRRGGAPRLARHRPRARRGCAALLRPRGLRDRARGLPRRPPILGPTSRRPAATPSRARRAASATSTCSSRTHRTVSAFYEEALGLRVSDWIGDGAVWLRTGAWHHEIAMLEKSPTHFHHLAFELSDFGQMRETLDHVAQRGRWVAWGPAATRWRRTSSPTCACPRRSASSSCTATWRSCRHDHAPRAWPDDVHSSNAWGTLPPRTYFRFDADSVRIEREQLMQLGLEFIPA